MSLTDNNSELESGSPRVFGDVIQSSDIGLLVVDDDPDLLDLTATFLEREREEFSVATEQFPKDVLDEHNIESFDAIVSDYDMPGMNGLELLEAVRDHHPDIPFVLFTGKGSEEIASEAISKGVTDYLQKETGSSQYSILANRVVNAVEQYTATKQLKRSQEKFSKLVTNSTDVLAIVNRSGEFDYISPACKARLGYEQEELIGECAFDYMPTEDRKGAMDEFFEAIENPGREPTIEFRFQHPDGSYTPLEARGKNMFDDAFIDGFVVNARDITDQRARERELKQQNEQLKDMRNFLSRDIQDPLTVASESLTLYRNTDEPEYLEKVNNSIERIQSITDQIRMVAGDETSIENTEQIALKSLVQEAWDRVQTDAETLQIDNSKQFEGDPERLVRAFELLFRNAVEHNSDGVDINVGATDSTIYVEDTGSGIPRDDREKIFEAGYTTVPTNAGLGLNVVKQIIVGHGWEINASEGDAGGARFDITDLTFHPLICD